MLPSVQSDLGLHCLLISVCRNTWGKYTNLCYGCGEVLLISIHNIYVYFHGGIRNIIPELSSNACLISPEGFVIGY